MCIFFLQAVNSLLCWKEKECSWRIQRGRVCVLMFVRGQRLTPTICLYIAHPLDKRLPYMYIVRVHVVYVDSMYFEEVMRVVV